MNDSSGAEQGPDPTLQALLDAVRIDPGAPFRQDALKRLADLKKADRAAFESFREQLKKAGCRVTELDRALAGGNGEGRAPTQTEALVALAQAADLFHTSAGVGYADIDINRHRETWPIRSKGFRRWLAQQYFESAESGAPSSEAMQAALNTIEAMAHFKAPERAVFVRVGESGDKLYLDLCDDAWRAVEIDAKGWRIVAPPPVRFRRSAGMRALPEPVKGGDIEDLRPFLNVDPKDERAFILLVSIMLSWLRPRGPFPVSVTGGEQGSAKSTRSEVMKRTIDPCQPALQAPPRNEHDLVIAAGNRHVLAYDNASGITPWLSDAVCRVACGAGFATRQLYTDDEEVLFDGARPITLNGIDDIISRDDLADRSVFGFCSRIPDDRRREEAEFWASFHKVHPAILGALLDAASTGLRRLSLIHPPQLPRMADFAYWATACEAHFWNDGAFLDAYQANIAGAAESMVRASPVANSVRELAKGLAKPTEYTATNLLTALTPLVTEATAKSRAWPRSPNALSHRLRRTAPNLRRVGVGIEFNRTDQVREITIFPPRRVSPSDLGSDQE